MKLEMLSEFTFTDLTDEDLLPVSRVLWGMRDQQSTDELRIALRNVIVEGKDLELTPSALNPIFNNIGKFRARLAFEKTQVPAEGQRTMALIEFGYHALGIPYCSMLKLLEKAESEGSRQAIYVLCDQHVFAETVSPGEKLKSAKNAIDKIGWKSAGDLLVGADLYANIDPINDIKTGAEKGNPDCCSLWASFLEKRGDYIEAAKYWQIAQYSHNPNDTFYYAMTLVGDSYGKKDLRRGEQLLIRSALAGSSEAAAHLGKSYLWGVMYAEGHKDYVKAEKFLRMADELGHTDAGYFLGCLYYGYYEDAPKELIDHSKAVRIWERLAKTGHADSLMEIGCFYYNGTEGYMRSKELAAAYFRLSAKGESVTGSINYAEMIRDRETPGSFELMVQCYTNALAAYNKSDRDRAKESFAKAFEEDSKITKPNQKIAEQIKNLDIKWEGTEKDTLSKVVSELKRILVSDRAETRGA